MVIIFRYINWISKIISIFQKVVMELVVEIHKQKILSEKLYKLAIQLIGIIYNFT